MTFNQKGQTKKFLKFLKSLENSCCGSGGEFNLFTNNTDSIQFNGNGTIGNPLEAEVEISSQDGNTLSILSDGLFSSGGGGDTPISSLLDAEGDNTLDVFDFTQTWNFSDLSGVGLELFSNSTLAAGDGQKLLSVSVTGANENINQETIAGFFSNSHTDVGSTNYAVYARSTDGDLNIAGFFEVPDGTGQIAIATAGKVTVNGTGYGNFYDPYFVQIDGGLMANSSTNPELGLFQADGPGNLMDCMVKLVVINVAGWTHGIYATNGKYTISGTGDLTRPALSIDPVVLDFNVTGDMYVGHETIAPTARVHIRAGGTQPGSGPLKLSSSAGDLLLAPEDGAFEFDGTNLFFTIGGVRTILI